MTQGADILFVRELLGGLYFGAPRWWKVYPVGYYFSSLILMLR